MSSAFAELHPKIQEAVWHQHWDELRPLQVDAIRAVLESEDHVILAAATASGKTEAAFLPILSKLAETPADSVQALYISPLKALINDQFRRLEDLCAYAGIPVHRWHGDVSATDKRLLRKSPGGVLLITPESLESQFINYDRDLQRIYACLRFVVIDELHAFLSNVRGIHLRSLLARLTIAAGVTPRRIGLSATIGDFAPAQSFICMDSPSTVRVIEDRTQQKELRVGIKGYVEAARAGESDERENASPSTPTGLGAIAADIAQRFRTEANLIFCNSRRQTELLADKLRGISERENWTRNPFLLHHGSLSRELREDAERELKSGEPVTAICTSTLEMGIDLGAVRVIGQVGPTWSVASLVQRLGRSGRREGEAQILRLYTLDETVTQHSSLSDRLYPELIRAIALLELYRERWLEPPEHDRFHFSTCVHQVLSVLRQTGGAIATHLYDVLCLRGAFRRVAQPQFAALLRELAAKELIEQVPTGELILAPAGRIVESRDFYAAFASRIEYRVENDGQAIGVLPQDSIPGEGEFLLLAGRRWRVNLIDHSSKRVLVAPAKGWKQPRFSRDIGGLHPAITKRMKRVLSEETGYPFLNAGATHLLNDARQNFITACLDVQDTVVGFSGVEWFPWRGSRVLRTLELCAKADGLKTERDDLSIRYQQIGAGEFEAHCKRIASGAFTSEELVMLVRDLQRDRFDEHLPETLLQQAFIAEVLDLPGGQEAAAPFGLSVG
jgi:ATP-dependent Lhr-like helicase